MARRRRRRSRSGRARDPDAPATGSAASAICPEGQSLRDGSRSRGLRGRLRPRGIGRQPAERARLLPRRKSSTSCACERLAPSAWSGTARRSRRARIARRSKIGPGRPRPSDRTPIASFGRGRMRRPPAPIPPIPTRNRRRRRKRSVRPPGASARGRSDQTYRRSARA